MVLPREGVDDALGFDDLAVLAAMAEILPLLRAVHDGAPLATRPEVALDLFRGAGGRAHPFHGLVRVGPYVPDQSAWRVEHTFDDEDGFKWRNHSDLFRRGDFSGGEEFLKAVKCAGPAAAMTVALLDAAELGLL